MIMNAKIVTRVSIIYKSIIRYLLVSIFGADLAVESAGLRRHSMPWSKLDKSGYYKGYYYVVL